MILELIDGDFAKGAAAGMAYSSISTIYAMINE